MADEIIEEYRDYDDEAERIYYEYLEKGFPRKYSEKVKKKKLNANNKGCLILIPGLLLILFLIFKILNY